VTSVDVTVRVEARDDEVTVLITDHGGGRAIPTVEVPDLEAKLAGEQKARGWGLFLIEKMVDEMHTHDDSGIVHVHANSDRLFTLGEFFDVWGVALGAERIGGYCDRVMTVTVNSVVAEGDPRLIEILDQANIEIATG